MSDSDKNPEVLTTVSNDMEAAMIVSSLAAHGVDATTSGEFTAGFRAEAPGDVQVLVRQCDKQRAQAVLENLAAQHSDPVESSTHEQPTPLTSLPIQPLHLLGGLVLLIGLLYFILTL